MWDAEGHTEVEAEADDAPLSAPHQLRHDDALQAAGSGGVLGRGQC